VAETTLRLAENCRPLWMPDGWKAYIYALLLKFHLLVYQIKQRGRGHPSLPKMISHPAWRYVQIVKQHESGRFIGIERRIVFGNEETIDIKEVITSYLERLKGTMHLHCTPLHRRTRCFAKKKSCLEEQLIVQKLLQCLPAAFEFGLSNTG
jgi:hypothetical protein